jgi:hypothetical protein
MMDVVNLRYRKRCIGKLFMIQNPHVQPKFDFLLNALIYVTTLERT